jgi:prevent-host-death family protein
MKRSSATVGVRELKSSLSRYLNEVGLGRSVTVTHRGRAIARLVPVAGSAAEVAPVGSEDVAAFDRIFGEQTRRWDVAATRSAQKQRRARTRLGRAILAERR